MSYHSHSQTPAIVSSPAATSPKFNLSGLENEVNASKARKGYLSTFFGRTSTGTANVYSMRRDNTMLGYANRYGMQNKSNGSIFSRKEQ